MKDALRTFEVCFKLVVDFWQNGSWRWNPDTHEVGAAVRAFVEKVGFPMSLAAQLKNQLLFEFFMRNTPRFGATPNTERRGTKKKKEYVI